MKRNGNLLQVRPFLFCFMRMPKDYRFIGICALVTDRRCNCYAGNEWGHGREYVDEMDWRMADEEQKRAYKKYINSGGNLLLSGGMFRKNEGGLTNELYEVVGGNFSIELFPCLTYAEIEGAHPEILNCIAKASLIRMLRWKSPRTEILDFRGTHLHTFVLDVTGVKIIFWQSCRHFFRNFVRLFCQAIQGCSKTSWRWGGWRMSGRIFFERRSGCKGSY